MAGTKYACDWVFYHNALSMLTARATRDWMRDTYIDRVNSEERWWNPTNGLNENTPYKGQLVGNRPEFMPLDMCHSIMAQQVLINATVR